MADLEAGFDQYTAAISAFVDGAVADQAATRLRWEDIQAANDLTDGAVADLHAWCARRHGAGLPERYPLERDDPAAWAAAVRSPAAAWAAALRVDLGDFMRDRFAAYVDRLAVRRDQRNRGIAQALLVDSFARGREHGTRTSELSTDSRTGALPMYERVGMVVDHVWVNRAMDLT